MELTPSLVKMRTIFQTEIYAILFETGLGVYHSTIRIFSNSQTALSAISTELVWNCHQLLMKFGQFNEVFLMRVLGYSNIDIDIDKGSSQSMLGLETTFGVRPLTARSTPMGVVPRVHAVGEI